MVEQRCSAGPSTSELGLLEEQQRGIAGAIRQSEGELIAERYTVNGSENERNLRTIKTRRAVLHEEARQVRQALRAIRRGTVQPEIGSGTWRRRWVPRLKP